ncbi:MAG TPA: hypothetical protein VFN85_09845 [Solirubrobacterales bacterium]|nr:hypothetical protein [Solirubrobacterales bacterium]
MPRLQAISSAALAALAAILAGCGAGGAEGGATVSVYAAAPLCREARQGAGAAGGLEVRVVCLRPRGRGDSALAAAGADARQATEDSTSVAFLEAPGPTAKFSQSIVEAAGVAWLQTRSGATAMQRIVKAIEGDGSSPRKAVLDEVG